MKVTKQGWFFFALCMLLSFMGEAQTRCTGITKTNQPCKMIVKEGTKCRFHSDTKIICGKPTKKGKPCQMVVKTTGEACFRHKQ